MEDFCFLIYYSCNQDLNSEEFLIFFFFIENFFLFHQLVKKLAKTHINSKCFSSFTCRSPYSVIHSSIIFVPWVEHEWWQQTVRIKVEMFLMCYPHPRAYSSDNIRKKSIENSFFTWTMKNWIQFRFINPFREEVLEREKLEIFVEKKNSIEAIRNFLIRLSFVFSPRGVTNCIHLLVLSIALMVMAVSAVHLMQKRN